MGPGKLRVKLVEQDAARTGLHSSTIAEILKSKGLVHVARKRARAPLYQQPFAEVGAPNQVWCADFQGWFRTGDGTRIDPLTISDAADIYCAARRWNERALSMPKPYSRQPFASMVGRQSFTPITACPSPR
jgi:hypothetical protein